MMVVFSPIFVADKKIILRYGFEAPLRYALRLTMETKRLIGRLIR